MKPIMMSSMNCKKFKGEIENYLKNGLPNFESKIDDSLSALNFKTWLTLKLQFVLHIFWRGCHSSHPHDPLDITGTP
jgi:hypothetical protein